MPRRALLTPAQREALMAVPTNEATLARHWVLGDADLRVIARRRRPHNRLGFAIQLCALRYPGRLLRPGELIPPAALAFLGGQLAIEAAALADYAARGPTRYERLGTLRDLFGFAPLSRPDRAALQAWLLPVALAITNGANVARALIAEFRRRRIIVPGISIIERMAAEALLAADRHGEDALAETLNIVTRDDIDGLLQTRPGAAVSVLVWVRQPPGVAGHRAFTEILDRVATLRAIGLDPRLADGVHPERLRQLAQEGARLSAQAPGRPASRAPPCRAGRHGAGNDQAAHRRRRAHVRPHHRTAIPTRRTSRRSGAQTRPAHDQRQDPALRAPRRSPARSQTLGRERL